MRIIVFMLLAACGAAPNQPVLANAPKPDPSAVAGAAAAAAAAITLASPDSHKPEKRQDVEKKPVKVKENVPAGVLDRLDRAEASKQPATEEPAPTPNTAPKPPRDALDFSTP